jgi:hypothetical protein
MNLDEKGRCCGRKPLVYKSRFHKGGPQKFCFKCDRAYTLETGEQIENWAWMKDNNGDWVRRSRRLTHLDTQNENT